MSRRVTVVTWHYVRDDAPAGLPARTTGEFTRQLEYIAANCTPVTVADIAAATADRGVRLPENACLLTFDDGYRDHVDTVFPMLAQRGWQGVFFPVASAARDRRMLDANRIQFAIATAGIDRIAQQTRAAIEAAPEDFDLPDSDTLYRDLAVAGLHNAPQAMFVKRALQTVLPARLRSRICADLFARHVSTDPVAFAESLYATTDELRTMRAAGMVIGGHGDHHERMNTLDAPAQSREFDASRAFLEELGVNTRNGWTFCYPYGAHDEAVQQAGARAGCTMAFALGQRIADLDTDPAHALPRIDTNDLPH